MIKVNLLTEANQKARGAKSGPRFNFEASANITNLLMVGTLALALLVAGGILLHLVREVAGLLGEVSLLLGLPLRILFRLKRLERRFELGGRSAASDCVQIHLAHVTLIAQEGLSLGCASRNSPDLVCIS